MIDDSKHGKMWRLTCPMKSGFLFNERNANVTAV